MFAALCVILVIALVLNFYLFVGRWRRWALYVGTHVALTVCLFMQSGPGKNSSEQLNSSQQLALGLLWLAIMLYLCLAALIAFARAIVLLLDKSRALP